MKIIRAAVQRPAVIILALTSFLLLSAFQAFAQDNSRASVPDGSVQKGNEYTFSHDLIAETITFEAINPTTQVPGFMTVTITGTINGYRLWDGQSVVGSHLKANQQATFSFVPYYPYSPSYSATLNVLQVAGDTYDDLVVSDFPVITKGSDGSFQRFMLEEVVTATEDGAQIALEQSPLPEKFITQPGLACGTVLH